MFDPSIINERTQLLADALLSLKTREECFRLLEDLFTMREIEDLSLRLQVAQMLKNGETYVEITKKTGASSTTVGRVNRALSHGANGYACILEKLKGTNQDD